jgi:hypothetical protein
MSIKDNLLSIKNNLPSQVKLIAVSKTYPASAIEEAYNAGQRIFGENKVQEMCEKQGQLPKDIEWHLIGHLQSNKVKYIAAFVAMIHSVDSLKLLQEINKQAQKNNRVIKCLIQIYIASEETKFGLDKAECKTLLESQEFQSMCNIKIVGLMGMATNTKNSEQIKNEFASLKSLFNEIKSNYTHKNLQLAELSMGMSSDYKIAIEQGSTMIRVGSSIFGTRQ